MGVATNVFFLGKGGVGKSTSAALTSLLLAEQGRKVLIVSLDPAHNQSDIFEKRLSGRPTKLAANLHGVEIDGDAWIRKYLRGVREDINKTYRYLTSFNLGKYFDVMKYSPGLEEYALILAFQEIRRKFPTRDVLVFDMAPTALSLRFFGLPRLSLVWIHHLRKLRQDIIDKRELITRVRLLNREIETDKVLLKIQKSLDEYTRLKNLFEDRELTRIHLVLNPDQLSLAESERIVTELGKMNIRVARIIVNKIRAGSKYDVIASAFANFAMIKVPYSATSLVGIDSLRRFIDLEMDDETRAALVDRA